MIGTAFWRVFDQVIGYETWRRQWSPRGRSAQATRSFEVFYDVQDIVVLSGPAAG